MEAVVFEIIMGIFFDAGMLAMVVHAAQHIGEDTGRVRFTAAVFAIGFFLGMIAKCVVGGSYIALALYALGFVLSYTAVVFTVPEKEHAYEVAEPFHLHGQMSDSFRAAVFIILSGGFQDAYTYFCLRRGFCQRCQTGNHCFFEHGAVPEGLAERGEVPYPGGIVFDRYSGRGADTHSF